MMEYCGRCGAKAEDATQQSCVKCGKPLGVAGAADAQTAPVATSAASATPDPSSLSSEAPARRRRLKAPLLIAGVVVIALLVGGVRLVGSQDPVESAPEESAPTEQTVSNGYASVTYLGDDFSAGVVPEVDPLVVDGSEFADTFGLRDPSGEIAAAAITAASQPMGEVEVSFEIDTDSLPEGAVPAVFYLEEYTGLWIPVMSELGEDGVLTGRTDHFTDFMAALVSGLESVEQGTQWLRFQVAKGVGARGGPAECYGEPPEWLLELRADDGLNAPLRACATGTDSELTLQVVANRAYSMVLDGPVGPQEATWEPALDASSLVYSTLSKGEPFRFGDDVMAAAGMATNVTWERGQLPTGEVVIDGRVNGATAALDTFVAAAEVLVGLVSDPGSLLLASASCLQGAFDASQGSGEEAVGNYTSAASDCLEPLVVAAGGTAAKAASSAVLAGVEVGLLMGKGAQTALDASAALNEPHRITLVIAEELTSPGVGSALLSDQVITSTGSGPSGEAADVIIGNYHAAHSATQWVSCGSEPAYADYDLGGRTRLTGLLGKRDYTPKSIVSQVDVVVDGKTVETFKVDDDPIEIDLQLPPGGDTLRLQAITTKGVCGSAPAGYLVWGNGAIN